MTTSMTVIDGIARLRLDEPRGNALSGQTMAVLSAALNEAEHSGAHVCLLEGKERVFCSGLDLRACADFNRTQMAAYVDVFEGLFERLFSFPLPVVAHLAGPAVAGGAIMALACDVRVMAPGAVIGLNEVELGLPFPSMSFEIGRHGLPASAHVDGLLLGQRFEAVEALERGVVQEVGAIEVAVERARDFLSRGPSAVRAIKRALRRESLERAQLRAIESRASFVDAFFAAEAQQRIGALVSKLAAKSPPDGSQP